MSGFIPNRMQVMCSLFFALTQHPLEGERRVLPDEDSVEPLRWAGSWKSVPLYTQA